MQYPKPVYHTHPPQKKVRLKKQGDSYTLCFNEPKRMEEVLPDLHNHVISCQGITDITHSMAWETSYEIDTAYLDEEAFFNFLKGCFAEHDFLLEWQPNL